MHSSMSALLHQRTAVRVFVSWSDLHLRGTDWRAESIWVAQDSAGGVAGEEGGLGAGAGGCCPEAGSPAFCRLDPQTSSCEGWNQPKHRSGISGVDHRCLKFLQRTSQA